MKRCNASSRGFTVIDAIIGLSIIAMMITTMAVTTTRQRDAHRNLAEHRAAIAFAHRALLALETGGAMPASEDGATVSVKRLDQVSTLEGFVWIELTVTCQRGKAELCALVERARADAFAKKETP